MNLKKIIFLLLIILLLPGCTITYNLDISNKGYFEDIEIVANSEENLLEYSIPAYFGTIGYEDLDISLLEKIDGVEYYNSKISEENKKLNYNYQFNEETFKNSNILNFSYKTFIVKKYDHDEDGKKDYMLFTTDNDFRLFDKFPKIENIRVNITCHYEVISNNADEVNENIYTWYLNKNNIKPINMVYNPKKVIDYRTLWEKILEGEYTNIFTISVLLFIIGFVVYLILKKKGESRDKI